MDIINGGVAQMVERSLSMREVPGSMPGSSITLFTQLTTFTICVNELHQPQHVRMAERSKAPDSRVTSLPLTTKEHSGPRMWAWVRIPLLTSFFHVKPTKGSFAIQQYVEMEKSPPSRIWTSDLRIPVLLSQLQSSALPTELSVVGVTAFTNLTYWQRVLVNGIKIWYVAEGGFDPPTSGLWAQHASSAPLFIFVNFYIITTVMRENVPKNVALFISIFCVNLIQFLLWIVVPS